MKFLRKWRNSNDMFRHLRQEKGKYWKGPKTIGCRVKCKQGTPVDIKFNAPQNVNIRFFNFSILLPIIQCSDFFQI